jgi:hypothetical protein
MHAIPATSSKPQIISWMCKYALYSLSGPFVIKRLANFSGRIPRRRETEQRGRMTSLQAGRGALEIFWKIRSKFDDPGRLSKGIGAAREIEARQSRDIMLRSLPKDSTSMPPTGRGGSNLLQVSWGALTISDLGSTRHNGSPLRDGHIAHRDMFGEPCA